MQDIKQCYNMMPFTKWALEKTEATSSCISPAMVNNGYLCIVESQFKQFLFCFWYSFSLFICIFSSLSKALYVINIWFKNNMTWNRPYIRRKELRTYRELWNGVMRGETQALPKGTWVRECCHGSHSVPTFGAK